MEGTFDQNTTVVWYDLNMKMDIPQGWSYLAGENELMNAHKGQLQLKGKTEEMTFSQFRGDSIYLSVNTYGKEIEGMKEYYMERQAGNAIYNTLFKTTIDGMEVDALYYGSKSTGTLGIFFEKDGIEYWISASNTTSETLPIINKIFASIRFDDHHATQSDKQPFAHLVLSEPDQSEIVEVKTNPLKLTKPDTSKTFECYLSSMGITFNLMNTKKNATCSLGSENIEITPILKEIPIDAGANRLNFYSLQGSPSYSYSKVSKQYDPYNYTKSFITNWSAYKEYIVDTAGVQEVNGKQWSIFISQRLGAEFMGIFTTYHRNYEVMVSISSPNRAAIIEAANVLETFKFE